MAPEGHQQPAVVGLVLHDFGEIELTEIHQHGNDRKTERDFVGNHLSGGADTTDERKLRVR